MKHGILIDYEWCTGCHSCEFACRKEHGLADDMWGIKINEVGPFKLSTGKWQYAYIPFPTDDCDLCAERVGAGKKPACVHHCQADCMRFGTLDELQERLAQKPRQVLFNVADL